MQPKPLYITYSDNIIITSDNMKLELKIVDLLVRNRKCTINQIATMLDEYYSFVHRTVHDLSKEQVLIMEKAGKAYLCSLNLTHEKTKALLQLSELEKTSEFYNRKKDLKLILDDFVKIKPSSIILFGSYAKGTATKESDIDLLILTTAKKGVDKITREIYAKYGKEINAIVMTPDQFKKQKSSSLIQEIIKDHYVLFGVESFIEAFI